MCLDRSVCSHCTKTFVNKQNLDRHIRIVHSKTRSKPVKVNLDLMSDFHSIHFFSVFIVLNLLNH
jgi:hypothetical protein